MQDERKFTDVVKGIESAEQDVDKVLDAGRLTRNEGPDRHMTGEQKYNLVMSVIVCVTILLFFGGIFLLFGRLR